MDERTKELLSMAVAACIASYPQDGLGFHLHPPCDGAGPHGHEWMVSRGHHDFFGATIDDALAALLNDLREPE